MLIGASLALEISRTPGMGAFEPTFKSAAAQNDLRFGAKRAAG